MVTAIRPVEPVSLPVAPSCRVLLLRDDSLLWLGLRSLLSDFPLVTVVGEAITVVEAVDAASALCPDLVMLPGVLADVAAPAMIEWLRAQLPTARFIVLLDALDGEQVLALCGLPIAACLLLSELTPAMLERILAAASAGNDDHATLWGHAALAAVAAAERPRQESAAPRTPRLTRQQQRVLDLIATGLSDQEIAGRLDLSPSTIASHIHELSARVGATNRFQIGWLARELGLVSREDLLCALGDRQSARTD